MISETERLRIRKFGTHDGPFVLKLVNTPGWLKFIGNRGVQTVEEAEIYLFTGPMASYEENGFGLYLVELKEGAIPIGMCGFLKREQLEDVDLGFAFLPEYFHKGYAYESAQALLQYGMGMLNLKKILAITTKHNLKSIRLLEKLGFAQMGETKFPGEKAKLLLFSTHLA